MILRFVYLVIFFGCFLRGRSQEYSINFLSGLPVNKQIDWDAANFELEIGVAKIIGEKFKMGIGFSYSEINLLSSVNILTFDWKILALYTSYGYKLKISEKFDFEPRLRAGYGFVKGQLNEAHDEEKRGNGIYIAGLALVSFKANKKLKIQIGCGYYRVFTKLDPTPLILTSNYIGSKGIPNQFAIKIGCVYAL